MITCLDNWRYYIGVRSCDVPTGDDPYMGSSDTLDEAIDRRGADRFIKKIIREFDSRQAALEHEIYLHSKYDVKDDPRSYNLCNQTSKGFDNAGAQQSEAMKRLWENEEYRAKQMEKRGSPEFRAKEREMSLNLINEADHPEVEFMDVYDSILVYLNTYLHRADGKHGPAWKMQRSCNSVPHTIEELCIINAERARISLKNLGGANCREFHYLYSQEEIETALARLLDLGVAKDLGCGFYGGVDFNASLDLLDHTCGFCGRRIEPPYAGLPKREGSLRHKACAEREDRERVGVETVEHLRGLLHEGGDSLFQAAHKAGFSERAGPADHDATEIVDEAFWSADR
jgi:hypothetical protein